MPSKSKKQHQFFEAIAHSPEFAKKVKVSKDVADEFLAADSKQHKFQSKKHKKPGSHDW